VSEEVDGRFFVSIHVEFEIEAIPNKPLDSAKMRWGLITIRWSLYIVGWRFGEHASLFQEGPMESQAEAKEAVENEIRI
jgi:hypothetical protein